MPAPQTIRPPRAPQVRTSIRAEEGAPASLTRTGGGGSRLSGREALDAEGLPLTKESAFLRTSPARVKGRACVRQVRQSSCVGGRSVGEPDLGHPAHCSCADARDHGVRSRSSSVEGRNEPAGEIGERSADN